MNVKKVKKDKDKQEDKITTMHKRELIVNNKTNTNRQINKK